MMHMSSFAWCLFFSFPKNFHKKWNAACTSTQLCLVHSRGGINDDELSWIITSAHQCRLLWLVNITRCGQSARAGSTAPWKWQGNLRKSWHYCKWNIIIRRIMRNFHLKMLLPRKKTLCPPLNITMTTFKLKWPITFSCHTWLTMRFPCMSKFPIFVSFHIIHFCHNLHNKVVLEPQVSHENTSKYVDTVIIFAKNLNQR